MTVPVTPSCRLVPHALLSAAATLASFYALAQQAYPSKRLRWIVAHPAGGVQGAGR